MSESNGTGVAPAGEKTKVEINETIEDPDMGDTLKVLTAVRDFPSEEQADLIAEGGEVVLLEVTVSPGAEYGGLVSAGGFEISWDDGADFWNNKTRMVEEELDAAGYTDWMMCRVVTAASTPDGWHSSWTNGQTATL